MSDETGPKSRAGEPDARGVPTKIVTLDDFAAWILDRVYANGMHDDGVERRFMREQLRSVANAALQQAAQKILSVYGPAWQGVAQEILKLRTAETEESRFGEVATPGSEDRKMILSIVEAPEPEDDDGGDGVERSV